MRSLLVVSLVLLTAACASSRSTRTLTAQGRAAQQIASSPSATWSDVQRQATTCQQSLDQGNDDIGCRVFVAEYQLVQGHPEPAAAFLASRCPELKNDDQRRQLVRSVRDESARLYFIRKGKPLPGGTISSQARGEAAQALPPTDSLYEACGVSAQ